MVLLTATPQILEAIFLLPRTSKFHTETTLPRAPGDPISHSTLIALSKSLPNHPLNTLLRGTHVYQPPPPPKPTPSPEYTALMTHLRAQQETKTYKDLLARQARDEQRALLGRDASSEEEEKDDISPSLVLNILLSIVLCAAAAFHLTKWVFNDGVRVLVALGTGVLVGVAEVTVYASYLRKVDESRTKERKKRERKEVIGEYTGEEDGVDARGVKEGDGRETEKIEIWGKGVNGGMRRRVQQKWDKEQEKVRDL